MTKYHEWYDMNEGKVGKKNTVQQLANGNESGQMHQQYLVALVFISQ